MIYASSKAVQTWFKLYWLVWEAGKRACEETNGLWGTCFLLPWLLEEEQQTSGEQMSRNVN